MHQPTPPAAVFLGLLLFFAAACAQSGAPAPDQHAASSERSLSGQILLPSGVGSRGVELILTVTAADSEPHRVWVLFDEQGHFTHTFHGSLTGFTVTAGLKREVYRIDTDDLPEANKEGQIDVGLIDLRESLTRYRLVLRAADGKPPGDVKVAMWFGLPPVGPSGEPVSLGSRQFPAVALGSETEWLLPQEADSIYFLVERPDGPARGVDWRRGHQRLFGPFTAPDIPAELFMD